MAEKKSKSYVDVVAHLLFGFFKSKIKKNIIENIEEAKQHVVDALFDLKRNIFRSVIEIIFLVTGVITLFLGLIVLLAQHYPVEYVLIGYGAAVSFIVLIVAKLK
ncbi:hypothetical protein KY321_01075 [Candidatus Woesearchaeota archaeon]|nr:hypothetical protein [Candidatus Woesearchaeota archaeon]